jgi:beta-N-acetylhexosaminidase
VTEYAQGPRRRLRAIRTQQGCRCTASRRRARAAGRPSWSAPTSAATAPSPCRSSPSSPTSTASRVRAAARGQPAAIIASEPAARLIIDLEQLSTGCRPRRPAPLARYAATIQSQRGDYNGRVLSIRQDDLRSLAVIYDASPSRSPSSSSTGACWPPRPAASDAAGPVAQGVGGLILFGPRAPLDLGDRLRRLVRDAPVPPIVASDEEGGSVQRLETIVGVLPSARRMAATRTPDQIRALAREAGAAMAGAGVLMDLAPVLDLDDRPGPSASNPDGTRSFSLDPQVASAAGLAFAAGLRDSGVVPVVKHFPGLGYSTGNTDDQPAATKPWDQLRRSDLLPFQDAIAAGIPAVMVANATVPGLTDDPAGLSRVVIEEQLRGRYGFDGLVVTDSLSAEAIRSAGYTVPAAAVAALRAGADLVLYGGGGSADPALTTRTIDAITAAMSSGRLDRGRVEEAAGRVLAVKGLTVCR